MASLDPLLLAVTPIVYLAAEIFVALVVPLIARDSRQTQESVGAMTALPERVLGALRTVKAFGAERREYERLQLAATEAWKGGRSAANGGLPPSMPADLHLNCPSLQSLLPDAATSQLDAGNEAALRDTVAEIARTTTVLVIAHRLSTVTKADRIIVINDGEVCDIGIHLELLATSRLYADLAGPNSECGARPSSIECSASCRGGSAYGPSALRATSADCQVGRGAIQPRATELPVWYDTTRAWDGPVLRAHGEG